MAREKELVRRAGPRGLRRLAMGPTGWRRGAKPSGRRAAVPWSGELARSSRAGVLSVTPLPERAGQLTRSWYGQLGESDRLIKTKRRAGLKGRWRNVVFRPVL